MLLRVGFLVFDLRKVTVCRDLRLDRLGEILRDLLGGLAVHPRRLREVLDARFAHAAHAAEMLEQTLAARRADAGNVVELRAQALARAAIAVERVREAV